MFMKYYDDIFAVLFKCFQRHPFLGYVLSRVKLGSLIVALRDCMQKYNTLYFTKTISFTVSSYDLFPNECHNSIIEIRYS